MSTYLVAFVVGPLEATEPVDVDGIAAARRARARQGPPHRRSALDVGAFCLRWFQDYYGIPYPSDKVDLVALPDFAAGAMENLGCITFRENLLLVDPATSTQHERELVADVVAHELAHMWFGDLVTMRWWNGIWLNEAFATFMEIAACRRYRPDWQRWTTFGLERTAAFETDSLAAPARSSTRSARPPTARACSTCSRIRRAAPSCACSSSTSATSASARASATTCAPRLRQHRDQRPVGRDRGDHAASRCGGSWTRGSGSPATRWSRRRVDGDQLVLDQHRFRFDAEADGDVVVGDPDQRPRTGTR